jgi:hypothetical protein
MTTTADRSSTPAGKAEGQVAAPDQPADGDFGNPNFSLENPDRWLYWVVRGGVAAVGLGVAGAVAFALGAEVPAAVLVIAAAVLGISALAFLPAIVYSRRNPERARRTAQHTQAAQERRLRRHPIAYGVGVTVAAGVLLPLRLGLRRSADHEQAWSTTTMVLIGVGTALIMGVVMYFAIRRARRRQPAVER